MKARSSFLLPACTPRQPGDSAPDPVPSAGCIAWKAAGGKCRNISSWSVTSRTPSVALASSGSAAAGSSAATRAPASASSAPASFSHSSVDWCTTWKSSSSRWIICSGGRWSSSSASVRM